MAIRIPIITTFDKRGINNALRNIDGLARQAGKAAGVLAGGVAVGIGASVREFAKFDEALNQSLAIMGNVSDTMRGDMSDAAREVAKTTTFSAEQAAESFFFLASAGLDAEQSVAALPQVAAFAQAGMFDMATATDLATDAQSALGLASDDAQENLDNLTRVTDVFVKANTLANTTVEQLASALTQKAGNALKSVGKDIEEGSATLAVFADQGIKGERAGTLLTNTLFGLTENAEKNADQFEKLGIQVFDTSGNIRNMADIAADVTTAFDGMTQEQKLAEISALGFTKQTREGVLALAGNSEKLREYEVALRGAGGTAQEVADNQLDTFNAKLSLLGSAVTDVGLDIGEKMAPKIEELIGVVERLLPKIGDQLIAILDQIDFEQVFNGISNFLNFIANNIQYLDELIIGLAAFAAGLTGFTTAVRIATVATTAFGLSLRALPFIGAIAAAVSALTVAIGANALTTQDAITSHDKLGEQIDETREKLEFYQEEQGNTKNPKLYQGTIEELEGKLSDLETQFEEATGVTYDNRDALNANKNANDNLLSSLNNTTTSLDDMTYAAINAKLGVQNLSIAQEAEKRFNAQSTLSRIAATGEFKSYSQILKEVTAETMFQTEEQIAFNEEVKQTGLELGLVVPGMNDATTSTNNLSTSTNQASTAYDGLSTSSQGVAAEVENLNGVMADGQKANSEFLDLLNGIEDTEFDISLSQATRELQGMIVEMEKADKIIRQEGGLFEFMQGGANVTAEFDEFGNLISAFTDADLGSAQLATGQTGDLDRLNDTILRGEYSSAIQDFAGGAQQAFDAALDQITLVNPETGMSRTIGGGSANAIERALSEGFEETNQFQGDVQELVDSINTAAGEEGDPLIIDAALSAGGIVTRPTRALIGEAGPEAVVPLDRAGGFGKTQNTININVSAGVGSDPVAIGREVVDAIKRYESVSGKVFASA